MTIELFDKNGQPTDNESAACAKTVTKTGNSPILGPTHAVTHYYVKYSGYLFDPVQMTAVDERNRNWKMRLVTQEVFTYYLSFLSTKKEHFRINAERLLNGQS